MGVQQLSSHSFYKPPDSSIRASSPVPHAQDPSGYWILTAPQKWEKNGAWKMDAVVAVESNSGL
jgi:hypothetical protein